MKVAVVILNWNGKKFLEQFLPSVIKYSKEDAEVIIADNGSTDTSIHFLKEHFPEVRIIELPENKGFTGGYNAALKEVEADYYVLLNSDIEVTKNWIKPVIQLMDKDISIAACQPKILSYSDKTRFEYAGAAGGYIDWLGYPFCRGRIFEETEIDSGQYNDEQEVFWATGACMFVRAQVFNELGGFDEHFFAHMEEIDLCWRMKNLGYKVYYSPNSTVYHVGGGTLGKESPQKTFLNFRNNLYLLIKNLPLERVIFVLLLRFIMDGVAVIRFLAQGNSKSSIAVLKAYLEVIINTLRVGRGNDTPPAYKIKGVYQMSIVIEHFLHKKNKFTELNTKSFF